MFSGMEVSTNFVILNVCLSKYGYLPVQAFYI